MSEEKSLEIRFGGLGGQGLVTLGAVLAEAAALSGINVAASQSYGSQARGGATYADVILSRSWIDFPHVEHPDFLVVLAQEAYEAFLPAVAPGGVVLADEFFVRLTSREGLKQAAIDATGLAVKELGNRLAVNFIMLGLLCGLSRLLEKKNIMQAVENIVSKRFVELNKKALELGWARGAELSQEGGASSWR
jgi:2-oxoglutarate ferredoxin oxidoreductase subunit gamma